MSALIGLTNGAAAVDNLWFVIQVAAAIGIVGFAGFKFIINPRSYKDNHHRF